MTFIESVDAELRHLNRFLTTGEVSRLDFLAYYPYHSEFTIYAMLSGKARSSRAIDLIGDNPKQTPLEKYLESNYEVYDRNSDVFKYLQGRGDFPTLKH